MAVALGSGLQALPPARAPPSPGGARRAAVPSQFHHFLGCRTSGFLSVRGKDSIYLLSETRGLLKSHTSADTAGGCGGSGSSSQWGDGGTRSQHGSCPTQHQQGGSCISPGGRVGQAQQQEALRLLRVSPKLPGVGAAFHTAKQGKDPGNRSALPPLSLLLQVPAPQPRSASPVLQVTASGQNPGERPGPPCAAHWAAGRGSPGTSPQESLPRQGPRTWLLTVIVSATPLGRGAHQGSVASRDY